MLDKFSAGFKALDVRVTLKTKVLVSLAILALSGVIGVTGTVAQFQDKATVKTTVEAGNIDIKFNEAGAVADSSTLNVGVHRWYPGAIAKKEILIVNNGSLPFKVSLAAPSSTNPSLSQKLLVTYQFEGRTLGLAKQSLATAAIGYEHNIIIPANSTKIINAEIQWPSGNTPADHADYKLWLNKNETLKFAFNAQGLALGEKDS